ncbi:hypothetical protein HYW44_05145 [Candidatus Daviesbacteria bacterium]|nr:hypothetical protein [Candidatus Daviesbacteria bacterium]
MAIIVGSVYYLVKFIQSRVASSRQAPQASVETVAQTSGSPEGGSVQGQAISSPAITIPQTGNQAIQPRPIPEKKLYNSGTFQVSYPNTWGILNCTNSLHFELDPNSGVDSKSECSIAQKPVTILVDNIDGCGGENVKVGNTEVIKSKKVDGGYTAYRWCTKTDPVLNITHRVSKAGERAVSPIDYANQIEEIISKLTFSRGS